VSDLNEPWYNVVSAARYWAWQRENVRKHVSAVELGYYAAACDTLRLWVRALGDAPYAGDRPELVVLDWVRAVVRLRDSGEYGADEGLEEAVRALRASELQASAKKVSWYSAHKA